MKKEIRKLILQRILSLYRKKDIKSIVLFGSQARSDFNKNSDYDIEVYLKRKQKKEKDCFYEEKIFISYTSPSQFKDLKKKRHSFLYCSFRDGIPLYGKRWFNKNKKNILKLVPSRETISLYLESSSEKLMIFDYKTMSYLEYEDGKSAANQLGFAMLMNKGIYPISPHTLKKEIINLDKKYEKVAKAIKYIQEVYYQSKKPNKRVYKKNIILLRNFSLKYISKFFPEKLDKIKRYQRIMKKLR